MTDSENTKSEIRSLGEKPKENVGSLLGLFNSEYFTLDMAMIYLYKKRAETGVHDFLVNKLYQYEDNEIDFYIPELCYALIRTRSQTLERFILDKCMRNISHFLKIMWCLNSFGKAETKSKKGKEYIESLTTKTEMAMVNGPNAAKVMVDAFGVLKQRSLSLTLEELESMKIEAERKRNRVEYLAEMTRLNNILISISLKLKNMKTEERKPLLKSYVKRINIWISHLRKKHAKDEDEYFQRLFHGIQMPFSSDFQANSSQVVRIIEDELTCFNTKKRAPYRIVLETIDMNEINSVGEPARPEVKTPGRKSNGLFINVKSNEDDWEDLIAEQFKEENSPTLCRADSIVKENYKDLVDFGKIAKEAEAKLKDAGKLKDVDLVQKYRVLRSKSGHVLKLSQAEEGIAKQSQTQETVEEIKEPEEPMSASSQNEDKIYQQKMRQFNRLFPNKFTLQRSQSCCDIKTLPEPTLRRCMSSEELKGSKLIKCMEKFKENHLPEQLQSTYTQILEEMRQEAIECSPSLAVKELVPVTTETTPTITGWGPWGELWEFKEQAIKEKSPFGHFKSYRLRSIVVKANDDLRQEVLVMQLIRKIQIIWKEAGLSLALRTYDILVTSDNSGVLEFVRDTMSIDGIKKKYPGKTLLQFFKDTYKFSFEEAQKNFIDSLAAYSLVCYLLQIKDRHNGNILLDAHGHMIHIDFGFVLTMSPGGINFETAPFKLTQEYADVMGGIHSATYLYFKMQLTKGFLELRKHVDSLAYILQVMMEGSDLPCFVGFDMVAFRERFKERSTDNEAIEFVSKLIDSSYDNWKTVQYDNFQKFSNGILP